MKILKTKDSEVMNLYFHNQFLKQASVSSELLELFLKTVKETAPGKTLSEIASTMGTTIDDLAKGTGKSLDELETLSKAGIKEVATPAALELFRAQWRSEMGNIRAFTQAASAIFSEAANLIGASPAELEKLRQKIINTRINLYGAKTSLEHISPKMIEGGNLSALERKAMQDRIKSTEALIEKLSKKEAEITAIIKSPNASAAPKGMEATKIETPKIDVPKPEPVAPKIKPAEKTTNLGGKINPFLPKETQATVEAGNKKIESGVKQSVDATVKSVANSGYKDPAIQQKVKKAVASASLSGQKEAIKEAGSEAGDSSSLASKALGASSKVDDKISEQAVASLPKEIQASVAEAAAKAKATTKANTKQVASAILEAEDEIGDNLSIGELKRRNEELKGRKLEEDVTRMEKSREVTNLKTEAEVLEAQRALEGLKANESFLAKIKYKFKYEKTAVLWELLGSSTKAIMAIASPVAAIATGIGKAMVGGAVSVGVPLVATLGLIGGAGIAGYYLYNYWLEEEPQTSSSVIAKLQSNLADASVRIKSSPFKEGTEGEALFSEISLINFRLMRHGIETLSNKIESDDDLRANFADIDRLDKDLETFFENRQKYCQDLVDPEDCDDLVASLTVLYTTLQEYKSEVSEYLLTKTGDKQTESGGIKTPVGFPEKVGPSSETSSEKVPYPVQIYDQTVDLSNLSGNIRMSAPRIIGKVFNSPEGMAFLDPANKFGGGFFGRTGEPSKDYLEALKYFYLNRIFDRHDLRKFVRNNLPKASRRRLGNYKEGLDYYKNRPFSAKRLGRRRLHKQENLKNLHKNFEKSANLYTLVDKSGNSMKKQADQFSKEYFKDAINSISEQYSKSYYEGFGKLYDVTPEKTSADYQQLYQTHQETGADLIEKAHPKSIYIADAITNGGLIENSLEQHRKIEEIALSMPSGNFRNRYAELIENLVKIANEADEQGLYKSSELIEDSMTKIIENLK